MKISALLNPDAERRRTPQTARNQEEPESPGPSNQHTHSKQKAANREAKDAPKFLQGRPVGQVNFPPHHPDSESLRRELQRFVIYPPKGISRYPRHIPYSSDKKRFFAKTGREAFEVFQYTFRYKEAPDKEHHMHSHDHDKEWTVMWDYNTGLVRITPFFKCQDYAKTMPAKVIGQNPGLSDLCHSITGGALAAQGYWMPFEAAKAIATIFCWKIRFALIPLFGPEIVEQCVHPDHPAYKQFVIDANITKRCMREQKKRGAKTNRNVSNVNAYQTEPPTPSSLPSTSQIMSKTRPLRSRRPSSLRLPDTDMSDNSSVVSTSHDCTPTAQADEQPYVTMGNAEQRDRQQPQTPPQTPTANPLPPTRGQNKKRDHSGFDTDVESGSTSTFSTPKARKRKVDVGVITRDDIRAACQLMALRYGSRWMHVRAF